MYVSYFTSGTDTLNYFYSIQDASTHIQACSMDWLDSSIINFYWSSFSFISTFYLSHIFWLVNLVLWSSIELTNSLISFFNVKNNLKTTGANRFITAYLSKIYQIGTFNRSFVTFVTKVWL